MVKWSFQGSLYFENTQITLSQISYSWSTSSSNLKVSNNRGGSRIFLGGGALVSCCTSAPINHTVFLCAEYQLYQKTAGHLGGGGVRIPCTLPLDPPLNKQPGPLILEFSWCKDTFNPWSPNSDQQPFSPNNPHTLLPRDKVMRINKDYQRENALILY